MSGVYSSNTRVDRKTTVSVSKVRIKDIKNENELVSLKIEIIDTKGN